MRHAFITGSAGFIGFYLSKLLLQEGWSVTGLDGLTDYYDVRLKTAATSNARPTRKFPPITAMLEDEAAVMESVAQAKPGRHRAFGGASRCAIQSGKPTSLY